MKKILTLLLSITAVPSFAVIGGVPSTTGKLYCVYGNKLGVSSSQMSAGTLAGSMVNINNRSFFSDNQAMMSYDIPFSKCPTLDTHKLPLIGIQVSVDDLSTPLTPIFNKAVDNPDFTDNLNIYAGGIISHNAVQYLQYMLDNRTDFKQYQASYKVGTVNLQINGRQFTLHKDGKSSVYEAMPSNYVVANDGLTEFLSNSRLDANTFISQKEAHAISDFITRYDSQNGFNRLYDMLTGMDATALGTSDGYELPSIDIIISRNKANTITLGLSYVKQYTYFQNYKFQSNEKPKQVIATIPVTIDLSNYSLDMITNTLNVSVNADKPYEDFVVLDYLSNGQPNEFILQYLFSANINSRAFYLDYSAKKNNDKFLIKK